MRSEKPYVLLNTGRRIEVREEEVSRLAYAFCTLAQTPMSRELKVAELVDSDGKTVWSAAGRNTVDPG